MSRFRAILATARVANMPSVVTNVLAGMMIGLFQNDCCFMLARNLTGPEDDFELPDGLGILHFAWVPVASGLLLYAGGNFLNDWKDAEWDRTHRPERAVPSGLVPRYAYLFTAIISLLSGVLVLLLSKLPSVMLASAIVACILIYTWLHKRNSISFIFLAFCRCGLVVLGWLAIPGALLLPQRIVAFSHDLTFSEMLTGFRSVLPDFVYLPAYLLAVFLQILAISLAAKGESASDIFYPRAIRLPVILFLLSILFAYAPVLCRAISFEGASLWDRSLTALPTIPAILWLSVSYIKCRSTPKRMVARMLAGIPLLDLIVAGDVCYMTYSAQTEHDPYLLAFAFIPFLAFALSLALQRLAPAT